MRNRGGKRVIPSETAHQEFMPFRRVKPLSIDPFSGQRHTLACLTGSNDVGFLEGGSWGRSAADQISLPRRSAFL